MANLTATLDTPTDNTRVIENGGAGGGGGAATALSALAKGLGALTDSWDANVRKKAAAATAARQAKSDARADGIDAATNDFYVNANAVQNGSFLAAPEAAPTATPTGVPFDSELEGLSGADTSHFDKTVGRLTMIDQAVSQGSMPAISKNAQMDLVRNQLFERYAGRPGTLEAIAGKFKEQGFDLLPEITAEQDFRTAQQKARTDEFFKSVDVGKSLTPPGVQMSDQEYYNTGRQFQADEAKRISDKNAFDATRSQTTALQGDANYDKTVAADVQYNDARTAIFNALQPSMQTFLKLSQAGPGVGQNAEYETKLGAVQTHLQQVFAATLSSALKNVTNPEAAARVRKELTDDFNSTIMEPMATRGAAFSAAMTATTTAFKMSVQEAAPITRQMTAMGMQLADIPGLMESVGQTPGLQDSIRREFSLASSKKLDPDVGKLHLINAIAMLKGEKGLRDMSTPEARKTLTAFAVAHSTNQARIVAAGNGNPEQWLNSVAVLPNAAATVSASSDPQALALAMSTIVRKDSINALNKLRNSPEHGEQAKLIGSANRAAVAHVTEETHKAARGTAQSEYYHLNYSRDRGVFEAVPDQKKWALAHPAGAGGGGGVIQFNTGPAVIPKPSAKLAGLISNLNSGIGYMADTTAWDPGTAPNGSFKDVREFWATGDEAGLTQGKTKQTKSAGDAITALDRFDQDLGDPSRFLIEAPTNDGRSKGERNNNEGNLEDGSFTRSQPGYAGSDGRFARFETPEHGRRAQEQLLATRYIAKGANTIDSIVNKYLGRGSENSDASRTNYKAYVAKRLNININDTLTAAQAGRLAEAMREFETGNTRNG